MCNGNNEEKLLVIPLGGVAEIGLNMTVFETNNDMIIVDVGLMFPDDDMPGVDYVIPDYSYVLERREKLRGIVITHGHEDHTGGLPFLLRDLGKMVPVYGTPLTLGLIKEKLREFSIKGVPFQKIKPRDRARLGSFTVEFIRVTHSIADGVGLGISTPLGNIIHTGDFKIDSSPVDGQLLDFNKFVEYGEKGTLLMLSDSTNAEKPGITPSEKEVKRAFEDIFSKARGRIIIATFASNIHRVQQAVDVSVAFGKKIILCGRSIISNAKIAMDIGYLNIPGNVLLKLEQMNTIKPEETVIITTGSQGEPMSVLTRIAINEHKHIKIASDDTVIVSAKPIPGNEKAVGRIINQLFKRGANVLYDKISDVHVSGHASNEELKLMLNVVRPRYFMPIHGEYRQLIYHAKLACNLNIPEANVFIPQNGEILEITAQGASKTSSVACGRHFVDGKGFVDRDDIILKDRRRLSQDGFVLVLIYINKELWQLVAEPEIIYRGFVLESASQMVISEAKKLIVETFSNIDRDVGKDSSVLQAKLHSALRKHIKNVTDKRPIIMPVVVEV
ncbi:MAG: ribonuclease J [Nitrospirae bacterium]|uniref:ribonuclease J n=1 Tax=Candidatus Magnetobacterium casense TaxID=1455061 RepID=UPI00058AE7CE|nr:ribonuclease J [Candidatus Magnetobacterium casensis]MBF0338311.1 ribonuclease J [Nitrospirota bacterium]